MTTLFAFRGMLWTRIKATRRLFTCLLCGSAIPTSSPAYRPITNGIKRQDRICAPCGEKRRELSDEEAEL